MISALLSAAKAALRPREMMLEQLLGSLLVLLPRCPCGRYAAYILPQTSTAAARVSCPVCYQPPRVGASPPAFRFADEAMSLEAVLEERKHRLALVQGKDPEVREAAAALLAALPRCQCGEAGESLFYGLWLCRDHAKDAVIGKVLPRNLDLGTLVRKIDLVLER